MKKGRTILVGLLMVMVLITVGFSLNAVAQNNSEDEVEIPEILQLNPSLDFDKEAIKEWAEEHSWKEARNLTQKAHARWVKDTSSKYTFARFYTPLMNWVEANYVGAQRFWSKEKVKERYLEGLSKPSESAYFFVVITRTSRADLKKENWKFVLEVGDKHWKPSNVRAMGIQTKQYLGTSVYLRPFRVDFDFTDMEGHPEWSKWNLYLIRTDMVGRKKLTWEFEK